MELILSEKTTLGSHLRKAGDHFKDSAGLDLYRFANGEVILTFEFPDFEETKDVICVYWKVFKNIGAAMQSLERAGLSDLGEINRFSLHPMFLNGDIELSCYVEKDGIGRRYFFRYLDGDIFMSEEFRPGEVRVKTNLLKLCDFVKYARQSAAVEVVPT